MNKKQIRKMQTAAGGPIRRIKFTPEQIAEFENQSVRVPGTNNSGGNRYREEGAQSQQYQEQEAKRKEEERLSRMEMRHVLKRKASTAEKLRGKKDEYEQVPQVVGMSGADPLLSFYVGGVGLNGIGALAKTGLWNIAKYTPATQLGNWGRGYFVGNAFKNSFNGAVPTISSQATSLLYQPTKQNESGLTSLKFFERKPSKISEAERQGKYKVERNIKQHGQPGAQYVDYSLINRNYEPWTVNERGQFVFESPEKAKKLSTIHFSLNEPVFSHIQGSWDDAPTITLLPYRNMRSQTAPADVAIMDTFFPNYNGLKVSSRGSKTLTGDKNTYEYYKSKGVDVEFSPELESLRRKIRILDKRLEMMPDSKKFSDGRYSKQAEEMYTQRRELADRMDGIVREWSSNNSKKIPSFKKLNEFGASEGFNMEKYPYSLGSPRVTYDGHPYGKYGLDYDWHTDPSNHAGAIENPKYALKSAIENNLRPEYIEWLKWLTNNKADYRKQGGKMNTLEFLKNGSGIHIKKKNRGKFTSYCGGKVTDECIRKAKASGNPTLVKRATFADNARHFKHRLGGSMKGGKAFIEGVNVLDSNPKMSKAASKRIKKGQYGLEVPDNSNAGVFQQWINYQLRLPELLKQKQQQEEEKRQQRIEEEQYKRERTESIINGVLNIGQQYLGNMLNRKSSTSVNNGSPSKTNFWNTPTIKNSQVTGDFWNTPTIANSLA